MRNLRLFGNGVLQFSLGTIGIVNDVCLKAPSIVVGEVSNLLGAGIRVAGEYGEHKLVNGAKPVGFVAAYRDGHIADAFRSKVLDGREPLSHMYAHLDLPDGVKDILAKVRAKGSTSKWTKEEPVIIVD